MGRHRLMHNFHDCTPGEANTGLQAEAMHSAGALSCLETGTSPASSTDPGRIIMENLGRFERVFSAI